jgi:Pyruvate/2-oxoacid:ferredoxin oxidoreductase gamma subunit
MGGIEHEVLLTGIGGQGVQLAARTLAQAAVLDGREVMVFGSYGGMMRGGNTDATVVIGDRTILTPPTVDAAWGAIVMHHEYWPGVQSRLRPGAVVLVDTTVFRGSVEFEGLLVVRLDATDLATRTGRSQTASMVALGAYAAATGLVTLSSLQSAAHQVLPPYRASAADGNAAALALGHGSIDEQLMSVWRNEEVAR